MKQKLQGLIAGVLIGATITGGAVIAANTTTLYDVIANGIKIVVDGKELHPTDAQGNMVEPMIYNGTTYLPVRAVANALGKAVYWDGPNFTVYLGDMNGGLEYPTIRLEDLISINDNVRTTNNLTDNYGNTYDRAVCNRTLGGDNCKLEYLLNMKYSRFKGTLYVPQGETSDRSVHLSIIADGKTIYTSPAMTKTSSPVFIDVNITGCNDIKIEFSEGAYFSEDVDLCLGDAGFYQ